MNPQVYGEIIRGSRKRKTKNKRKTKKAGLGKIPKNA